MATVGDEVRSGGLSPTPEPPGRGWAAGAVLVVVKGTFAAVGAVYIATGSVVVTLIASVLAVMVLALALPRW